MTLFARNRRFGQQRGIIRSYPRVVLHIHSIMEEPVLPTLTLS